MVWYTLFHLQKSYTISHLPGLQVLQYSLCSHQWSGHRYIQASCSRSNWSLLFWTVRTAGFWTSVFHLPVWHSITYPHCKVPVPYTICTCSLFGLSVKIQKTRTFTAFTMSVQVFILLLKAAGSSDLVTFYLISVPVFPLNTKIRACQRDKWIVSGKRYEKQEE